MCIRDSTVTDIPLTSSTAFPSSGEIRIGSEDISYTANNTATGVLSGGAREVNGTTKAAHSGGDTVTNISDYVAWGDASTADFTIAPGLWVLDNYGTKLIALIYNGPVFQWDGTPTDATNTRATIIPNAPTKSRHMIVSTPDRHLVFFGTETTVGDSSTQDDMFIDFQIKKVLIKQILILLPQTIPQAPKDLPTDQGSWELLKVGTQSMSGQIQHYF